MPSACAASITVVPGATCSGLPSISMLQHRPWCASDVSRATRHCLWSMWCWNSSRKCLMKLFTGSAAASPSAQIVRPAMLSATEFSRSRSSLRPCAALDAVDHAPQPAGAFAARRALAARLLVVEVRQAQQRLHHAARLVHDDHRARAEHRARLGDRVVVHVGGHHHVARQHRHRRAAGNARLELAAAAHAAGHLEQRRERRAELHLEVAGTLDVARHREELGAAVVRPAEVQERLAAVA